MSETRILLEESEIPSQWYNVVADMPNPPVPPLGPDGKPIGPEALKCKQSGEARTLFFNLSGHGHFDMASYDKFFSKELEDYEYPAEAIEEALHHLPKVPRQ